MNLMNKSLICRMITFSFCACANWSFYDTIILNKSPIHFLQINRPWAPFERAIECLHQTEDTSFKRLQQVCHFSGPVELSCRTQIFQIFGRLNGTANTVRLNCQTFILTIIQDFIGWLHANEAKLSSSQTVKIFLLEWLNVWDHNF